MTMTEQVRRYVALDKEKKELKVHLRTVQSELDILEPEVLEAFIEEGVDSIKVDGRTVSPKAQVWVSPKREDWETADEAYERACGALAACGLGQFTGQRFNSQMVSSYVREILAEGSELPSELEEVLNITERHTVSVRQS